MRGVTYVARQFAGLTDLAVTLLHVLPGLPPRYWDIGHILSTEELKAQRVLIDRWLENQGRQVEPFFDRAREALAETGIVGGSVQTKVITDSADVPTSILEEAKNGGYLTLVLGRCGSSGLGKFLMGSTTSKIMNNGAGVAVCVVE